VRNACAKNRNSPPTRITFVLEVHLHCEGASNLRSAARNSGRITANSGPPAVSLDARDASPLATRRDESRLTQMLRDLFAALRDEVTQVRFALQTALAKRRDLLAKVGVPARTGGKRPKGAVDPPPAGTPTPPAEPAKAKPQRPRWTTVARLVAHGRTMIQAAIEDAEIVVAIETYSYTKEALEGLLGRLYELERLNHDQEAAKGAKMGATKEVAAAGKSLRAWFLPWKKRLMNATRGKNEMRTKLGI